MDSISSPFIVELTSREGRVCERYETFEEAQRRVEHFPPESLMGPAFIFQELPDGSQRLLREDGKPLQFHREPVDELHDCSGDPMPLAEDSSDLVGPDGKLKIVEMRPPEDDWDDEPLAI